MVNNPIQPHNSSVGGLQANVMALLCYLAGSLLGFVPGIKYVAWLAPLAIFLLEKESRFVRFHAMQAFLLDAVGVILGLLVSLLLGGIWAATAANTYAAAAGALGSTAIVGLLATVVSLIILVFAVIAMTKAYKYETYRIPIIGGIAARMVGKAK